LATIACALVAASAARAQTPPPTLAGEILTGVPQVTSNCDLADTSTISYTVSGTVVGPYTGTYTESGVATIGPQPTPNVAAAPVLTFSASFVIDSPTGYVTGTKELTTDIFLAGNLGFCTDFLRSFGVAMRYSARIHTADGTYADAGKGIVAINEGQQYPQAQFTEVFVESDYAVPVLVPMEAAKVTGGGSLVGTPANTGFVVQRKVTDGPVSGEWQFVNKTTGDIVHSLSITDLEVSGNTATFSGSCRNENAPDGAPCSFRVTVTDNGEGANAPPDTVAVGGTGFTGASGALAGNIQIH
jgi:hypothetical protein